MRNSPGGEIDTAVDDRRRYKKNSSVLSCIDRGQKKADTRRRGGIRAISHKVCCSIRSEREQPSMNVNTMKFMVA